VFGAWEVPARAQRKAADVHDLPVGETGHPIARIACRWLEALASAHASPPGAPADSTEREARVTELVDNAGYPPRTYRKPASGSALSLSLAELELHGPLEVVAWAELDSTIGWKTWPEVWHLDEGGRLRCCYQASSLDSIRGWSDDVSPLLRSRREGVRTGGCADRWLIIESRAAGHGPGRPDGSDAEALLVIRSALEPLGVVVVDAMVFDNDGHWWSMQEAATGALSWPLRAPEQ
jgi:hypothetical protein